MDFLHQAQMGFPDIFRAGAFFEAEYVIGFFPVSRQVMIFGQFPASYVRHAKRPQGGENGERHGQATCHRQEKRGYPDSDRSDGQEERFDLMRGGFQEKAVKSENREHQADEEKNIRHGQIIAVSCAAVIAGVGEA